MPRMLLSSGSLASSTACVALADRHTIAYPRGGALPVVESAACKDYNTLRPSFYYNYPQLRSQSTSLGGKENPFV